MAKKRILDRFGKPIPVERVRRAVGFVEHMLPDTTQETITGITPPENVDSGWIDHEEEPWRSNR